MRLPQASMAVALAALSILPGCSTYRVIQAHDADVSEINAQIRAGGDENAVAIAFGLDVRDVRSRAAGYTAAWRTDPARMSLAHLKDAIVIGLTAWAGKEVYDRETEDADALAGDVSETRAGHTFNLDSQGGSISLQLITGGDGANLSDAGAGASQGSGGTANFQDHAGGSTSGN